MLDTGLDDATLEARGALWTAREIAQQPRMLGATRSLLDARAAEIESWLAPLRARSDMRVILTGAGTSAFIGECLAPYLDARVAGRCEAIATTDIVAAPQAYLHPRRPMLLVSFARSGNSPESLACVELAERLVEEVHHLVITCNPRGELASFADNAADARLVLLPEETHDRSFAMTSSFSCMMFAGLALCDVPGAARAAFESVQGATESVIGSQAGAMRALATIGLERVVYLGSHVLKGLAHEAALKQLELSDGACVALHDSPLGFRHGPKTVVNARTLVVVFVSNDPHTRRYDLDLVAELAREQRARGIVAVAAGELPDMDNVRIIRVPGLAGAADVDLLVPFVALAQMLAFHSSMVRGLSPDNPNRSGTVNRVVQGVRIHEVA